MIKDKKRQVNFYVEQSILNRFQELYPRTMTRLLTLFLKKVIKDKNLFDKVFFE